MNDDRVSLDEWQARLARHDARIARIIDTEAQVAFWQAQHQHALAELEDDALPCTGKNQGEVKRWVAHEVAAALNLAVSTAGDRIAIATRLVRDLPQTLKRLEAGELTLRHARAIVDAVADLTPDQIAVVEDKVLPESGGLSVAALSKRVEKAVHELHPTITEDRRTRAIADRAVWLRDAHNGTVTFGARGLDPVAGASLIGQLDTLAEAMGAEDHANATAAAAAAAAAGQTDAAGQTAAAGQTVANPAAANPAVAPADLPAIRTPDQRRADALIALPYAGTGETPRVITSVSVSVALSTLIGLDEQPGDITAPGITPGTALTATQARLLAQHPDSVWRRLITDPIGRLIDYGRTTYRPPAALADHIRARDRHCVFPNCHRQAEQCEIDHHHDWALGGTTTEDNLGDLCPRDHQGKHKAGWKIVRLEDGTTRWTSPTGRTYDRPPATYPIDHTSNPADNTDTAPTPPVTPPADEDPPPF